MEMKSIEIVRIAFYKMAVDILWSMKNYEKSGKDIESRIFVEMEYY